MEKLALIKATNKKYFALTIHQRINSRQFANALNTSPVFKYALLSANITSPALEKMRSYPRVNNGIFHKQGKGHSKYPDIYKSV